MALAIIAVAAMHGDVVAAQVGPLPTPTLPSAPAVPEVQVPSVPIPDVPEVSVPKVDVPEVSVPKVEVPKVEVPKVEVPKVNVPKVSVPKVDVPTVSVPNVTVPGVSVPKVSLPGSPGSSNTGSGPGASSAPALSGLQDLVNGLTSGPGGSGVAAGAAAAGAGGPGSRRATTPHLRRLYDQPLRGRKLRRLRRTLSDAESCISALPPLARRELSLRAGLGSGRPLSRRVIARRLGIGIPAVIQLERASLRALREARDTGQCGAGGTAAGGVMAVANGSEQLTWGGGEPASSAKPKPGKSEGGSDVRGVTASGGPEEFLDPFNAGGDDTPYELLLLAALAIASLATVAALRSSGASLAAPLLARRQIGERPLLFLDVDGVLALSPLAPSPPPGNVHYFGIGALYVPDRAGEFVRELERHFELVWATGWEHRANQSLRLLLGLTEELPVISFGGKARFGSSDWKTKAISRYAGNRPAAWLDDNFDPSHEEWAERRKAPTLLIPVDTGSGLAEEHVASLIEWADDVQRPAELRPAEQQPAS